MGLYNYLNYVIFSCDNYFPQLNLCIIAFFILYLGEFNVMCEYESCSHWVEVKTKEDIGAPGKL